MPEPARDACPSLERLAARVEGLGSEQERENIERHLDACDVCARRLDELSRDQDMIGDVRRLLSDPGADASAQSGEAQTALPAEILSQLRARPRPFERYRLEGELGRGGMGVVRRAWDEDLGRALAMKLVPTANARTVGRFVEEAQVSSRLDHPGIVPVHDLGLAPDGSLYFTMKLVRGRTLAEVVSGVGTGEPGQSVARVTRILLSVCEAMAYAHAKGVLHRDLKPSNIMVGRYGEVFVMDWGLARVLGRADTRDLRLSESLPETIEIDSDRRRRAHDDPDSPLYTLDGDVVGTPSYMSPEQALGRLDAMGPKSDVYAVGAMLYHLLAGAPPYMPRDRRLSSLAVWALVQSGPPRPLASVAPEASPELVAIAERAMQREPEARYESMSELAADLEAWMEGRVVQAYEGGAVAELKSWVRRNRPLATSITAAVLLLASGLVLSSWLWARAETSARIAEQRASEVFQLAARTDLEQLLEDADRLWPVRAELAPSYRTWLQRARRLLEGDDARSSLDEHRMRLASLMDEGSGELERGGVLAASGDARDGALHTRWWRDQLERLVRDLERFGDERDGLLGGTSVEHGQGVEQRLALALELSARDAGPDAALRQAARAHIADRERSPVYAGLDFQPGPELLPLGRDRLSGLQEFAHLPSGPPARRGSGGELVLDADSGLVLVLVPAGTFSMGAQAVDPGRPNFDALALLDEAPVHERAVDAFLLSKYEVTQGQWRRWTGSNPSSDSPETFDGTATPMHPVEHVSWQDAGRVLGRLGLVLPTEAQWEYAARAGTTTPWWAGDRPQDAKLSAHIGGRTDLPRASAHVPVDSLEANGFGLYCILGNIWEWCADPYGPYASADGAGVPDPGLDWRVARGGSFASPPRDARATRRMQGDPRHVGQDLGLRPARALEAPERP